MKKNDLVQLTNGDVFRILDFQDTRVLAINCQKKTMPQFFPMCYFENAEILECIPTEFPPMEALSPAEQRIVHKRFTMIAAPLSAVNHPTERSRLIASSAKQFEISKQSIRTFLCTYLIYQDIAALAPKRSLKKELTQNQKNMRWALNKFFYNRNQDSLPTAYAKMLKAKYCTPEGALLSEYPSFHQFRYFYQKTRKLESYYISRNGRKEYQRNHRPLLGDGVQEFAPLIGTAMLDGTICDIYLINEAGQLVGRPVLVVACDANTSLCLGYALLWEGGTYSLQSLMLNILEDKVALCKRMGIPITTAQWNSHQLPGVMVTDGGTEYKGQTFEQITELGVTLINLPSFRPELKGPVEKLFDLVQNSYKDSLKGKGVIMPDFQERGAHDYRKDASLTLSEFERIVVKCIIHYNCGRIIHHYPYTQEMLDHAVPPYANAIWNWKLAQSQANLISISKKDLILTLLPRTIGKFTRFGLRVNKLRYYADGYKERFLKGGDAVVAFNPDNCNTVWLKEKNGTFVPFSLIQSQFTNASLAEVQEMQGKQKQLVQDALPKSLQSKIELMSFIEAVSIKERPAEDVQLKGIRSARQSARKKNHIDIGGVIE